MKILIINTVILNGGDAAILKGVIKVLKCTFGNDTNFVILDSHPRIAKKYYPELVLKKSLCFQTLDTLKYLRRFKVVQKINQFRLHLCTEVWGKGWKLLAQLMMSPSEYYSLKEYDSADLVVTTGGTYLVEYYDLESRILELYTSINLNKNLIFYTQSLGPFTSDRNKSAFTRIFEHASLVLLRDKRSEQNILDLGIDNEKLHVCADAAFALAKPESLQARISNYTNVSSPIKIAISVRRWRMFKNVNPEVGFQNYLLALKQLTQHLIIEKNAEITFLSTCQGIRRYRDDSQVATEIVNLLPKEMQDRISINRDYNSPEKLAQEIQSFDLIIATRLHMAILALGVGIPVFPIIYEFKTQELFRKLNLLDWTVDIETIQPQDIINKVDSFILNIPDLSSSIFSTVLEEYQDAMSTKDIILNSYR